MKVWSSSIALRNASDFFPASRFTARTSILDGVVEFKKVPHRQGHDHDENGRHDEQDRDGMDIADDQQKFLFQGVQQLYHA